MVTIHDSVVAGFIVGFVGDLLLNVMTQKLKILDAGLIDYFPRHKTLEAAFIAGGLVAFTVYIALQLWEKVIIRKTVSETKHLYTIAYLFIFGAIFDNFFRFFHLMPTLDGMYEALSPPVSMFFAGGPLVASYLLALFITSQFGTKN